MAKRKEKDNQLTNMIDQAITEVTLNGPQRERKLVDVITFCENEKYLNFLGQDPPLKLWPMQRIVLKMFYRGTRGNEHLELDDHELETLEEIARQEDLDYIEEYGGFRQVIEKYKRRVLHNILVLVMGRRSSKTLMVSIIAAYEAYRLLETPDGNPHRFYGMSPDKPIAILNVAVSEAQAYDPLFLEIRSRLARSPYFSDKINHEASTSSVIYLLTDNDKRENAKREKRGMSIRVDGSVVLKSGHSNSASLRGQAAICILFDEFAHFMSSTGKQSGDEVYNALTPSVQQFGVDGKIVLLSDPRGKEGMFWRLFQMSQDRELVRDGEYRQLNDEILAIQLPTWRMNPSKDFSREHLERTKRPQDPVAFSTSYAARFVGEMGDRYFDERRIEEATDLGWREPVQGDPKYRYFIHLDPATTSHNYGLCLCHVVTLTNRHGEVRRRVVVDTVRFWAPDKSGPVSINEVEKYIRDLCRRFNVAQVSFDVWQSAQTMENLALSGIRTKLTPYNTTYIMDIYTELRNLLNEGNLSIPPIKQLRGEMKNLMYKILARGIKKMPNPKSEFPTDDCVDALAGAAFQALHSTVQNSLPKAMFVRMMRG